MEPSSIKYSEFVFGETVIEYILDQRSLAIGLRLLPRNCGAALVASEDPIEPLVHLYIRGESRAPGFSNGRTMRCASPGLAFSGQEVIESGGQTKVVTRLASPNGYSCAHTLSSLPESQAFEISTTFRNDSDRTLTLEMITSFTMGGFSPFTFDSSGRLLVHRFRSGWCMEGRHEALSLEQLHLEASHCFAGNYCERFGQIGSLPVRGFFPFVALEDTQERVFWGAQLAWAGSWQMEVFRKYRNVALSGGLADREFGHWFKHLSPGQTFTAPTAIVATACDSIEHLCAHLTSAQKDALRSQPALEQDLPILCNEWCTTWGKPTHDIVTALAQRVREVNCRILVIDAGWFRSGEGPNCIGHGDWTPNPEYFPNGLQETARKIRSLGLIPGLWFEMETCATDSTAFSLTDHLLKLDGESITVFQRRFWDMRDPWVHDYLTAKVVQLLEECEFGYLKIDYNETLGIGCDGAESPGEGLRCQIEGVYAFLRKIRARLPDLIIENCASGGHRLEPSMMRLTAQSSFSDAHENLEIPIVAANLHRLILPRQSQIWAVLRRTDTPRRLIYSLTATLLGRMCLSGDLLELSVEQWKLVVAGCDFYRKAAPLIRDGFSRRYGPPVPLMRDPHGWQAVVRTAGNRALVVAHTFAHPGVDLLRIELPQNQDWQVDDYLCSNDVQPEVGNELVIPIDGEFCGAAVLLSGK